MGRGPGDDRAPLRADRTDPWYEWLDDNRATIDTALEEALDGGPPATLAFALVRLLRYWIDRKAEVGDDFAALFAAVTLGIGAAFIGDPNAGLGWTAEILRRQAALGIHDVGDVLEQRGSHLDAAGRPDDAVRTLSASAARQRRVGRACPRTEGTAERLDRLRSSLGTARFTLAWRTGQHLEPGELAKVADRTEPPPEGQQPGSRAAR